MFYQRTMFADKDIIQVESTKLLAHWWRICFKKTSFSKSAAYIYKILLGD